MTGFFEPGSARELARFAELQARLPGLFRSARSDPLAPRTVVIVPGLSLDPEQLARIRGTLHYEERHLAKTFGESYREYQRRVPYLLPFKVGR